MLQKVNLDEDMQEEGQNNLLRPAFYWELLKRRIFYFAIPLCACRFSRNQRCVDLATDLSVGRQDSGSIPAHSGLSGTRATNRDQRRAGSAFRSLNSGL